MEEGRGVWERGWGEGGCGDRYDVYWVQVDTLGLYPYMYQPTEQCKQMRPAVDESIAALQRYLSPLHPHTPLHHPHTPSHSLAPPTHTLTLPCTTHTHPHTPLHHPHTPSHSLAPPTHTLTLPGTSHSLAPPTHPHTPLHHPHTPTHSLALALFPGLPRFFCSSVSVDNNTRMQKGGEKCGRPGIIHHMSDVRWTQGWT